MSSLTSLPSLTSRLPRGHVAGTAFVDNHGFVGQALNFETTGPSRRLNATRLGELQIIRALTEQHCVRPSASGRSVDQGRRQLHCAPHQYANSPPTPRQLPAISPPFPRPLPPVRQCGPQPPALTRLDPSDPAARPDQTRPDQTRPDQTRPDYPPRPPLALTQTPNAELRTPLGTQVTNCSFDAADATSIVRVKLWRSSPTIQWLCPPGHFMPRQVSANEPFDGCLLEYPSPPPPPWPWMPPHPPPFTPPPFSPPSLAAVATVVAGAVAAVVAVAVLLVCLVWRRCRMSTPGGSQTRRDDELSLHSVRSANSIEWLPPDGEPTTGLQPLSEPALRISQPLFVDLLPGHLPPGPQGDTRQASATSTHRVVESPLRAAMQMVTPVSGASPVGSCDTSCDSAKAAHPRNGWSTDADGFKVSVPQIPPSELRLRTLLGKGGYGSVYRARWEQTEVAIKVLHSSTPSEQWQSLRAEAILLAEFRHPCICTFFGMTEMNGSCAIVMELLSAGSLSQLLEAAPAPRAPSDAALGSVDDRPALGAGLLGRLAWEVASGIAYLHRNNYMHRDVKASNVMLDGLLHAKVCDFGIVTVCKSPAASSSVVSSTSSSAITPSLSERPSGDDGEAHTLGIGTLRYMAPEVLSTVGREVSLQSRRTLVGPPPTQSTKLTLPHSRPYFERRGSTHAAPTIQTSARYSRACDVYSFGMLLWEIMHQQVVFSQMKGMAVALTVVRQGMRPPIELSVERAAFHDLIESCGRLEPEPRPHMSECAEELLKLLRMPEMRASMAAPPWALAHASSSLPSDSASASCVTPWSYLSMMHMSSLPAPSDVAGAPGPLM